MNTKLYIGNLRWSITDDELKQYFFQAGGVRMATVIMDRNTGRSKGFGFVEMETEEEAHKAKQLFDGQDFNGRRIIVSDARPEGKEQNRPASNFNKLLADFIDRDAKVGDNLGFSVGKKHFNLTRDDQETDFNPPRKTENY